MRKSLLVIMAVLALLIAAAVAVPTIASANTYTWTITIEKVCVDLSGGNAPSENFTFELWRDLDNDGVIDAGDLLVDTVTIEVLDPTQTYTGTVTTNIRGVHLILEVDSGVYSPDPVNPKIVYVPCTEAVTFTNATKNELATTRNLRRRVRSTR